MLGLVYIKNKFLLYSVFKNVLLLNIFQWNNAKNDLLQHSLQFLLYLDGQFQMYFLLVVEFKCQWSASLPSNHNYGDYGKIFLSELISSKYCKISHHNTFGYDLIFEILVHLRKFSLDHFQIFFLYIKKISLIDKYI